MKKIGFLFLIMMLFRTTAFATPQVSNNLFGSQSEFRKSVEQSQTACADMLCPQAAVQARLATHDEWLALPKETRTEIRNQVKERAADWSDTILEGDFQAKGKATLDAVYFLEANQKVIGYRFIFSRQAWDTSTCPYDPSHPSIVEGCQQGRIMDAAFLSSGLEEAFQDEQSYAHFVADTH